MSAHRASIIIASWNGRRLLETCLPRALRAIAREGGNHEVIVVDDASTDETAAYVRREFPEVRVIALEKNLRFGGANNAAARAATGDVLVFLNNDMQVHEDFLGPLLRHFDDPAMFAVTAQIEMAPRWMKGGWIRETGLVRGRFEDGFFVLQHDQPEAEDAVPVFYAGGGSSAVRRDRFLALGGFDRLFRPFYFEDLDLSYRAQKSGWTVLYEPRSRVLHAHRQTNSETNFPGGFVDRMFGKNSLLFTWKVLTDQRLLNQHFRSLWRRLMRPAGEPRRPACFTRAVLQLPELLAARRRGRTGVIRSDQEVLQQTAAPPVTAFADGGMLAYGSTGTGKRLLVAGFAPLPFERERRLSALCFRSWHVAQALLMDGHDVTLVGVRTTGAYENEHNRPPVLRFQGTHFTYYSVTPSIFEGGGLLQELCDRLRPDALVTVHAYPTAVAARLKTEAPLWADLNGSAMTEAQAKAAVTGDERVMAEAWQWERAALARADVFSVVSNRQKYTLIGELAAVGRLQGRNYGVDPVHVLPNAIEPDPYRHARRVLRGRQIKDRDFVVLWAGGYNTWTDVDTLFAGLKQAMRQEPRLRFVSLGGAIPGRDEQTFYRFRRMIEESEFADRFLFPGWVPNEEVPNYYFEADVGLNIDRASYEMLVGCRYRIVDMLRAGLPVVTSLGTEISHVVQQERLGEVFTPGDSEGLAQALVDLARDESRRRRCADRAREYMLRNRLVADVLKPLRAWAQDPQPSPDRMPLPEPARTPSSGGGLPPRKLSPASLLSEALIKGLVRRRAVEPWGLAAGAPPQTILVLRAGVLDTTRAVVTRLRERYPHAEVMILAPAALASETEFELGGPVLAAPSVEACGYQLRAASSAGLRARRFEVAIVAGENNRRAELVALLSGARRKLEVREDGAAHAFGLSPVKPLLLLAMGGWLALQKLGLTALLGLVWGSLTVEGWSWRFRHRRASPAASAQ